MTLTIKKALKLKNKLIGLISEEFQKANTYNSMAEGDTRPYDVKESLDKWFALSKELVELKTKIHLANAPVYGKIFQLSELKNQVKFLKSLNCLEGSDTNPYRSRGEVDIKKTVEVNVVEREKMVKAIEAEIETIQDELDAFNHVTHI